MNPTRIVYLHGFGSSPLSKKAQFFGDRFAARGIPFTAPDLAAGDFEHLTISSQLRIVEQTCAGEPAVLMGSSLGGYLAALYAARHPEVQKVVLMAPAFCFGRRWKDIFGPEKSIEVFHYGEGRMKRLSSDLAEDAANYEDYPDVKQPALLFHGLHDDVVPPSLSEEFAARHSNAELHLLDSDHELVDVTEAMWSDTIRFL